MIPAHFLTPCKHLHKLVWLDCHELIIVLLLLQGPHSKLRVLNVKNNLLSSLQHFAVCAGLVGLRDISIAGGRRIWA